MLVLPIVNKNRILNVSVSIKDASKVRTGVRLDDTNASDIIVNGRSFLASSFNDSHDSKDIIDFIRANSILYKRNIFVSTKEESSSDKYDIYEVPLPWKKINDSTDGLYIAAVLDMQKETPNNIKGKYFSFEKLGFDEVFSDEKVSIVKRIVSSNGNSLDLEGLFKENGVFDLIETLEFMRMFDFTVIGQASIPEDVFEAVLSSFDRFNSKDTKSLKKYYNMALTNRDIYAKMSYVNKLVYDRSFDIIKSEGQKKGDKQFIKTDGSSWESMKSA